MRILYECRVELVETMESVHPCFTKLNGEAAHQVYRRRRLLGTHQWQPALLKVGLPVSNLHS